MGQSRYMDEGGSVWFWKSTADVRAATNVKNADYPRITADGRLTFRVHAPEARKVQVDPLASFAQNNGYNGLGLAAFDLMKDVQRYWTVTTPPAVPGVHYYQLLIDGAAVLDPSSQSFAAAYKEMSTVEVPESGVDFYHVENLPYGQVPIFWHDSKLTKQARRGFVYLPPGYDDNSQPTATLILDWGKLCTVIDPASGVKRTLWVMIAVLGFSRYPCARVVWRNDVATTLAAIESIWQELGGVASRLTSDNPKCFALTANAQNIRNVPGRKTDVNDAAWIADLLAHG